MRTLNFITGNKNKLAEVQAILGDTVEVQNRAIDVPEIQGTSEEIAKEKCRRAAEVVGCLVKGPSHQTWEHMKTYSVHQSEPDRWPCLDRRHCT